MRELFPQQLFVSSPMEIQRRFIYGQTRQDKQHYRSNLFEFIYSQEQKDEKSTRTFVVNETDLAHCESRHELMLYHDGLTYNPCDILPSVIDFPAHDVKLDTQITENNRINTPLMSSATNTVTENGMAIAMALYGDMGIILAVFAILEDLER
ncbi:unnamed protein product [Angiostrongylus costaricensis]|uniref:IMPDH domain-containing protein n=1 Tax=Angiostrongylus costaricensis TaxID=334426 RepID=A0A158PIG6_ANGCS|nr:unnamed protein product [Angiostrongylus costaricensis]